jgi:metallo-beta-lactamase family protein
LNAGHILGAAMVEVHLRDHERELKVVFRGDLGRYDAPLQFDPVPRPECDVLVIESTYGDREHRPTPMEDQIGEVLINCIERKGTVLIPSFTVGRSQLVTLILRERYQRREAPRRANPYRQPDGGRRDAHL